MLGAELMKRLGSSSSFAGVDIQSTTVRTNNLGPWKVDTDGLIYQWVPVFTQYISNDQWAVPVPPTFDTNLLEIRAMLQSGQVPTVGTLGVWQSMGADREWGWSDENGHTSVLKIEIRIAGTTSIIDSAIISFIP